MVFLGTASVHADEWDCRKIRNDYRHETRVFEQVSMQNAILARSIFKIAEESKAVAANEELIDEPYWRINHDGYVQHATNVWNKGNVVLAQMFFLHDARNKYLALCVNHPKYRDISPLAEYLPFESTYADVWQASMYEFRNE